ncbi:MAG: phosphatidylserine decarboxylase family protein, partial [Rhodospirillales bacterium]|nr:phosphatidylserine decarboxylase family protein [Rhodospirillales bacterium]
NSIIRFLAEQMIKQVPAKYKTNPAGGAQIQSISQMLALINAVIQQPPPYNDTALVGFPINAILDWSMGTPAGSAFFRLEPVNAALKGILQYWCEYLKSPESLAAFEPDSWGSPDALKKINIEQYKHRPGPPPWGFASWNNFFIREFNKGEREVAGRGDPSVIVSACESTPFAIQKNVKREDTFWIKAQPYSLEEMLAGQHVDEFVGGTVYQAFLNAFNYHRWHSPVSGKIVSASVRDGSYYAEAPSEGFDPGGPNLSQGFIAHVATRAIIFIQADNPAIGLVAVIPIGMSEVSSNILQLENGAPLEPGVHVDKGDQLGYFQFGGSTHCLVFRPGVIDSFDVHTIPGPNAQVIKLKSKIATARS